MANKNLFQRTVGRLLPKTDVLNHEWAPAYDLPPKAKLAQYAATGCLNTTFYASASEHLETVLGLADRIEPEFIAKTAVYAREKGSMKDMPALLAACLTVKDQEKLNRVFDRVIDNGKMLRNFVQIMRSGMIGRKSLGTAPKRLVAKWLERRSDEVLFRASVGNEPSLADIIKMVHPAPANRTRAALYGHLIGRNVDAADLPGIVRQYEAYKATGRGEVPDVPFQMLTALKLGRKEWSAIARKAGWQMIRMNLNTFVRHGVFDDPSMVETIAGRLRSPKAVREARIFPYQLMTAFKAADDVPTEIREALQDAMEIAIGNVPKLEGQVVVCPDVSGSMTCASATGRRKGSTSAARCIDIAALAAAAFMRRNPKVRILPFEDKVVEILLNPRDSVMTNADKLSCIGGGGTNCSAPLAVLNKERAKADLVVFISDNQSWVDAKQGRGTETLRQWAVFKRRNPKARMICIDIQPYGDTQAPEGADILNVGGFSDQVFAIAAEFAAGRLGADHWVGEIERTII